MIYPKIPLAQSIIEICKAKGIEHIVISPGSRNAPLTIGFTNNSDKTIKYIYFEGNTKLDENAISRFTLKINDREMTSEDRDIIIKDLKARNIKITRNTISSAFENMIHKTLEPKREKTV